MPGFFVSNTDVGITLKNRYSDRCTAEQTINCASGCIKRSTLAKFLNDKAFCDRPGYVIVTEGVLLNKTELLAQYNASDVAELIEKMYESGGETFFSAFRGGFSGALYDKAKDKWIVFTNQIGDGYLFYYYHDGVFAAGSQFNYLIDFCREKQYPLSWDEGCAYQILTFGYAFDDTTFAAQIKRLRGGTYFVVEQGKLQVREYHVFRKNPERFRGKSEAELVEYVDEAFVRAIRMEYAKDEEYGYRFLADLSGGLDSRMNIWTAHEIGHKHLQLLTYCKGNYLDEIIAKQIAAYWKDEILVKQLDDASFLYDIDEIVFLNGGLSLYSGITGGKRLLEVLNKDAFGIEHTGMIGDAILGSFFKSEEDEDRHTPSCMYSERLRKRLDTSITDYYRRFDCYETYLIYARLFHGAVNTHMIRKNYVEPISPFLDVDFIQTCLDIPVGYRIGHRIYKRWIMEKHPQADRFVWEKTGARPLAGKNEIRIRRVLRKGPKKLAQFFTGEKSADHMNPIDYWLDKNAELSSYLDRYAEDRLKSVDHLISPLLRSDLEELYQTGNATEKAMVLTVLSAAKMYFLA